MTNLSKIFVAILAGGLGTRLASILPGKQKVMAKVGKHSFLEFILFQLENAGFKNIVLCTGYLGSQVYQTLGKTYKSLSLYYSNEQNPLGTAGAIRHALPLLKSDQVLVINGDSFLDVDLKKFLQFHLEKNAQGTILLTKVSNTNRYGKVELNGNDEIITFQEKKGNGGSGFIHAGYIFFKRSFLRAIPEGRTLSFEKDIFPKRIGKGLYGFKSKGRFIDIGTPQSYRKANSFFSQYLQ